jgi:hypothetical protein
MAVARCRARIASRGRPRACCPASRPGPRGHRACGPGEGCLAVRVSLVRLVELDQEPADPVERVGLPGLVVGGTVELERLPGVLEAVALPACRPRPVGKVEVGVRLPGGVVRSTVQAEGSPQVGVGAPPRRSVVDLTSPS